MIVTNILIKVFTKEFYRLNAGFFLVILGLVFGFMSGVEHLALAQFFISSNILIWVPISFWLIYTLKVISFNHHALEKKENAFISTIAFLRTGKFIRCVSSTIFLQLLPVFMYAGFLLVVSVKHNLFITTPFIFLSISILLCISMLAFSYRIRSSPTEINPSSLKIFFDRIFKRPFPMMALEWLMRNEFLSWIGTKVFAFTLLLGILQLYRYERYDYRLLAMGVSIVFTSNIILLNHLHRFENKELVFYRNMPLRFVTRFLNLTIAIIIICLPELGLLITRLPAGESFYQSIPMAISIPIGYYGFLFCKDWGVEKSVKVSLFITLTLIVLILSKTPLFVLAVVLSMSGIFLWKTYYYRFEYTRTDN